VTVTFRAPSAAEAAMENVVVRVVVLDTFTVPTVIPLPLTPTAVDPATKFVPANVTPVVVPCPPATGSTDASVGTVEKPGTTVNVTDPLVPPGVVTVTFLAPGVAELAIENMACNWVED